MKFYLREYKNDFAQSNMSVQTINDQNFTLSWFKATQVVNLETHLPEFVYPTEPTVTENINIETILTENKTNLPLNNPHQIIACGVSEESGKFVFVDVLKYTYNTKSRTGFFKNASTINPVMYILVPFADAILDDLTFIVVADSLKVDNAAVTNTFDFDINKTLADIANEYLPSIELSKDGTEISAQLKNADGSQATKAGVDIYFETTTGYLTKSRATTNSLGIATTELVGSESGKVKAGFKYFSGKTQIII